MFYLTFIILPIIINFGNCFILIDPIEEKPKIKPSPMKLNIGNVYDIKEIKNKNIEKALSKLDNLKKYDMNILYNKYFSLLDKGFDELISNNPTSFRILYPNMYNLFNTILFNDQDNRKQISKEEQEILNFFHDFDISILYKNKTLSLHKSRNENSNRKIIEYGEDPEKSFIIPSPSHQTQISKSLYETLLIFRSENMDFKEIIERKYNKYRGLIFEDYYILLIL